MLKPPELTQLRDASVVSGGGSAVFDSSRGSFFGARPRPPPAPSGSGAQSAALASCVASLEKVRDVLGAAMTDEADRLRALERLEGVVALCRKSIARCNVAASRSKGGNSAPRSVGATMDATTDERLFGSVSAESGDGEGETLLCPPVAKHASMLGPRPSIFSSSTARSRSGVASPRGPSAAASPTATRHGTVVSDRLTIVGPPLSPSETASYGQVLAASIYLALEALLVRTESDRLSLFLLSREDVLCKVMTVGAGTQPVVREQPASTSGIVSTVFNTGIAVNIAKAELEDAAECGGPTAARNTLVFPISSAGHAYTRRGALQLVNHRRGAAPFTEADELLVLHAAPIIAAIAERYPTNLTHFTFDPAPLHRWCPLPVYAPPTIAVAPSLAAPPQYLVLRRAEGERLPRRHWAGMAREIDTSCAGSHLLEVEGLLATLDGCWRDSVAENMMLGVLLQRKERHIHDAREIIVRKQKKVELLKDVLCDEVERHLRGESAVVGVGGHGGTHNTHGSARATTLRPSPRQPSHFSLSSPAESAPLSPQSSSQQPEGSGMGLRSELSGSARRGAGGSSAGIGSVPIRSSSTRHSTTSAVA